MDKFAIGDIVVETLSGNHGRVVDTNIDDTVLVDYGTSPEFSVNYWENEDDLEFVQKGEPYVPKERNIVPEYMAEAAGHTGEGDKPLDIEKLDVFAAINYIGWKLGQATDMIGQDAEEADVDWNALLARALELIELGHQYEGLE